MGWWFILCWLDAGVPSSTMLYVRDEQRCLQVAQEHIEGAQARPDAYLEVIYLGCVPGGAPRVVR
jgi:hypothetical protein